MTIIKTGPFLPIIVFMALGMAGYITYRRRKTV
jgi:LPXTG-motif cell wall-anchored protein